MTLEAMIAHFEAEQARLDAVPVAERRYSVGTWDFNKQAYTRQRGLTVPSINISLWGLHRALRQLRDIGYSAHRIRDLDGGHDDNDWAVLVQRTDCQPYRQILEVWKR